MAANYRRGAVAVDRVRMSEAEVRPGNAMDALRASLTANAEHGKRREPGDYRRAYDVAVRNRPVAATDVDGLAALIRCTGSWAEKLTCEARAAGTIASGLK